MFLYNSREVVILNVQRVRSKESVTCSTVLARCHAKIIKGNGAWLVEVMSSPLDIATFELLLFQGPHIEY